MLCSFFFQISNFCWCVWVVGLINHIMLFVVGATHCSNIKVMLKFKLCYISTRHPEKIHEWAHSRNTCHYFDDNIGITWNLLTSNSCRYWTLCSLGSLWYLYFFVSFTTSCWIKQCFFLAYSASLSNIFNINF